MGAFAERMKQRQAAPKPGSFAERMAAKKAQTQAPAGVVERAGRGFVHGINPLAGTVGAWNEGGANLAGGVAGDIGNLAATGAMVLGTGGAGALPIIARQTALGGAMGAAGGALAPVSEAGGKLGRKVFEDYTPAGLVAKALPEESGSTFVHFLKNLPGGIGETLGELGPQAAIMALTGKMAQKGKPAIDAKTAAELRELEGAGYPLTEAHLKAGDTRLKAATTEPFLAPEAATYKAKLAEAAGADIAKQLDTGGGTTYSLGEQLGQAFREARGERSTKFEKMMESAESGRGRDVVGVGKTQHAGKRFAQTTDRLLKSHGVDVKAVKEKALIGEGLNQYDVPAGLNPADITAAIRFSDLASQKAGTAAQLNRLASVFAKTEKLFGEGGASKSGFSRTAQRAATDLAAKTIKQRDKAIGPAGEAVYPQWAKEKANWAKFADLVDEFGEAFGEKKTRLTKEKAYSAGATSPEKVFERHFAGKGSDTINKFKEFLEGNGQDPKIINQMGKDWLADKISKSADPAQALSTEWRKLKSKKEWVDAIFDAETVAAIEGAIERSSKARSPFEVMGTKISGESPTQARQSIAAKWFAPVAKTGAGAAVGGILGGPAGALTGAALGAGAEKLRVERLRNLLTQRPDLAKLASGAPPKISAEQARRGVAASGKYTTSSEEQNREKAKRLSRIAGGR